jgi:L-alanine-DL-glutamate epimerase-like enolase superfamily enzyme
VKIVDVKATNIDMGPVEKLSHDATVKSYRSFFGLVEVFTDEGITGVCPSYANPRVVEKTLKPRIVGQNPLDYEKIWALLQPRLPYRILDTAKIDIAIWDLIGKILNQPVWRLLGGAQPVVRVYCAGGLYAEGKTIADLQEEMVEYVEMGFDAVKMKVAGAPFKEDVARVQAVREAIGPDVDLLVDGNHGWTVTEAIQFARRIEEFEPYWLEEPVESQHPRANAEVTMAVNMPTASGENLQGRHAFRNLIDAHGADIIQADAFNCGGITEWRKIAAYAQAHNLRMAPHGNAVVGSHLVASMPHGLIVESGPMQPVKSGAHWRGESQSGPYTGGARIFAPPEMRDGKIVMSERPGLGLQTDEDLLKEMLKLPSQTS